MDITIVSGDKDMMQLVDGEAVTQLDTMKDVRYGPAEVVDKWGVPPEHIIDMLALMGDSSDNIPGVRGIGPKGAAQMIGLYGGLDAIFAHKDDLKGRNKKPMHAEGAEDSARLSYELATIKLDVEVELGPDELAVAFPPKEREQVTELFQLLEFHRFLDELGGEMQALDTAQHELIVRYWDLRQLVDRLRAAPFVAIDLRLGAGRPRRANIVGVSLCDDSERASYIPLGHSGEDAARQLPTARVLDALKPLLQDPELPKVGHDLKAAWQALANHGVELQGFGDDLELADYLLQPSRKSHDLAGLALTWLGHKVADEDALLAEVDDFAALPLERVAGVGAERAHVAAQLRRPLHDELDKAGLRALYRDLELPLVPVLARMEQRGVRMDADMLQAYSAELGVAIAEAEAETWKLAGREFNSASPKQLAQILFEELGLPVVKRTKTGPSTAASVLEVLAEKHPLPEAILRFRSLSKLKNTYVDALPPLLDERTGRIHTCYHQAVAATGRLSSSDPNLQNIRIRTAEGRRIREAFLPAEGCVFLSADYSQVELRVLAHLCGGEGGLAEAFAQGLDVHSATAAQVFGVPLDQVTPELRRTAKAINFGIAYGQTAFGLAQSLNISRSEAKVHITAYNERFPEVAQFMERTVAEAQDKGFVATLLGRRRRITELTSSNFNQREGARRMAINTPVQGSAADIIKLAMLRVEAALREEFPAAKLLMQVHDELVIELPESLVDPVSERVVQEMETALELRVPLRVDTGVGHSWGEAH